MVVRCSEMGKSFRYQRILCEKDNNSAAGTGFYGFLFDPICLHELLEARMETQPRLGTETLWDLWVQRISLKTSGIQEPTSSQRAAGSAGSVLSRQDGFDFFRVCGLQYLNAIEWF